MRAIAMNAARSCVATCWRVPLMPKRELAAGSRTSELSAQTLRVLAAYIPREYSAITAFQGYFGSIKTLVRHYHNARLCRAEGSRSRLC